MAAWDDDDDPFDAYPASRPRPAPIPPAPLDSSDLHALEPGSSGASYERTSYELSGLSLEDGAEAPGECAPPPRRVRFAPVASSALQFARDVLAFYENLLEIEISSKFAL